MIPVIDLFAGPGGLGEGFSSLLDSSGNRIFETILSIEMNAQAHATLQMRAYFRNLFYENDEIPSVYIDYLRSPSPERQEKLIRFDEKKWQKAAFEAQQGELSVDNRTWVEEAKKRLGQYGCSDFVLIGGPPCQAYSLVGRARRAHDEGLATDAKQTLYKCYLQFIKELSPAVFVMENVKGILSAQHEHEGVFSKISSDMKKLGYNIRSLAKPEAALPSDYVVRSEEYGIPQARHRVILLGIRNDGDATTDILEPLSKVVTVGNVLTDIPLLRSGFSKRNTNWRSLNWSDYIKESAKKLLACEEGDQLGDALDEVIHMQLPTSTSSNSLAPYKKNPYRSWYRSRLGKKRVLSNHESRTHLGSDLERYLFCSSFAKTYGYPAKLYDFPKYLIPAHANAQGALNGQTVKFADRFRVQIEDEPSTTITSHIAKDGHYYIHPDPCQCRSLTVREAARLQTFPDDYFFEGNRTSQYIQVGNAVPPLLAQQIAKIVARYLGFSSQATL